MQLRVGLGYDVHPFATDGRSLVLGGVQFADAVGLAGHSDSDVIAHACIDALLGAAGMGDIGAMFPDTDERWAGADSVALLATASAAIREAGWQPVNIDTTVVLDEPHLADHRAAMASALSAAAGAPVTVKAKRTEGVGALGRGEGIACWAVALLQQDPS